jgi:hypothetical protein
LIRIRIEHQILIAEFAGLGIPADARTQTPNPSDVFRTLHPNEKGYSDWTGHHYVRIAKDVKIKLVSEKTAIIEVNLLDKIRFLMRNQEVFVPYQNPNDERELSFGCS